MKKIVAAFGFALAVLASSSAFAQSGVLAPPDHSELDYVFTQSPDDHVVGEEDASVTIIAYASVTCPHCSAWFKNVWPTFKEEQIDTGNVKFILREFPTAPANIAYTGFMLANCAPEEERFDHIVHQMQNQDDIFAALKAGNGKETYEALGQKAGLEDAAAMDACFADKALLEKIQTSAKRGQAAGMTGVPAFFVNGEKLQGEATSEKLAEVIAQNTTPNVSTLSEK